MKKGSKKNTDKFISFFSQKYLLLVLSFALLIFYFLLYKIYIPRINAFGCFDDCNNFMGGYFLLHGKKLFSEIFFNHNPLMAYTSLAIQYFSHPQNLYELILRHRQALLLFSFLFNLILIFRFSLFAFGFAVFFELTKFYLFGDRFLAEPFIVYPLVYLTGLALLILNSKKLIKVDYILLGIFTWFIIFIREPYIPAVLFLFVFILFAGKNKKFSLITFSIFITLSVITVFFHNIKEFYFNVVTTNANINILSELTNNQVSGFGFFKIFLYPINIYFGGEWGYFRYLLVFLNTLFIINSLILIKNKQWKFVLFLYILLGLCNIRYVVPGKAFYAAFHLLCWYAIFLFASFAMLSNIVKWHKKTSIIILFLYFVVLFYHIFSPQSFLNSKPDPHTEFITNYGGPLQVGSVINELSFPADTLFLDGFDDIIYWQSQRYSTYKYSWYTSLMPFFKKYTDARAEMFAKSPPDFYYGSCPKEKDVNRLLPATLINNYQRLYSDNKPSCLWVKKSKLALISDSRWQKAAQNHYFLYKK